VLDELEPLAATPTAYGFVVLLGLLWGSFANVCIYRWPPTDELPEGRSVVQPGSHCFACKTPIRWYDNVPLVSWLWLRGRCRSCKAPFSARYLLVEALTGLLFGLAWWATTADVPAQLRGLFHAEPFDVRLIRFAIYAAFCTVMVVVTFIDLDHKLILLRVPTVVAFYALGLLLPGATWWGGLVGIAVGYGVPWGIGEIYYRLTGREGLGLGDAMLLALVGALLGWKGVLGALFGGSTIGAVIGLVALTIARRRGGAADGEVAPETTPEIAPEAADEGDAEDGEAGEAGERSLLRTELPFGPFLAMAAVFYLYAEPWIQLYFRFPGE
jgi:leader peptidase (prepilin peptidase) / N-methyltransferase